jgi:hypothetical protein
MLIDPLGVKSWFYNRDEDTLILSGSNYAIFQKPNGEIRIIEIEEQQAVNRSPMFLEEALIGELMKYRNERSEG